jgi:hypothetical protein
MLATFPFLISYVICLQAILINATPPIGLPQTLPPRLTEHILQVHTVFSL